MFSTYPLYPALLFVPFFSTFYLFARLLRSKKYTLPLPPGPRGLPFIGSITHLPPPGKIECKHWLQFKDRYGPISSMTVLGQTFVIIHDADIAFELLRERAVMNSGRPEMVFSGNMIGWSNALAFLQTSDKGFNLQRRNIAKVASSNVAVAMFDRIQEEESAHFLLNVLARPQALADHIRMEAGAVILKIVYGYTPEKSGRDPLVDLVGKTMEEFADCAVPGKWTVDIMPFLRFLPDWCPGTGFKKTARAMKKQLLATAERPYAFVKQEMREKRHKTSYMSQAIEGNSTDAAMDHAHKWSATSLYLGGADTTVSALMTFFLAMTLFPGVQKIAQEELDRVTGGTRLPVSKDKANLPYIEACVKEAHRWFPIAPMALPHTSNQEQTIRGYRIPKGAMMLVNNWWLTHDPAVYPDPEAFKPERFFTTETHKAEPDPRNYTFGYGRRVCPGRYVADNALFITIAQALAVFDIAKPVENGKIVEPVVEFQPGVVTHPVPYQASIKPRSEKHRQLILSAEEEYPWKESDAEALRNVQG